jgi:hypothetical protein
MKSFGEPSKPNDKEYCGICGRKLECLTKPGCNYWPQYIEWKYNRLERKRQDKIFFTFWIVTVIITFCFVCLLIG